MRFLVQNIKHTYILLLACLLATLNSFAKVYVSNDFLDIGSNKVYIKWVGGSVVYPDGSDVYRREKGTEAWKKLTAAPVKMMTSIPSHYGLAAEDKTFIQHVFENPRSDEFKKDVIRALMTLRVSQSYPLADLLGLAYVDETAQAGKEYEYKVITYDGENEINMGISPVVKVENYAPIAPPQNIEILRKKKEVTFHWDMDASAFITNIIERSEDGKNFSPLTEQAIYIPKGKNSEGVFVYGDVLYSDNTIQKKKNYCYRVASVDYFGQTGTFSKAVSLPYKDLDPPLAPTDVQLVKNDQAMTATISWKYSEKEEFAGFNVWGKASDADTAMQLNSVLIDKAARTYTVTFDKPNLYFVEIHAVDEAGNATASSTEMVEIVDKRAPQIPNDIKASYASGVVTLNWTKNTEADFKGYYLARYVATADSAANQFTILNGVPFEQNSYQDTLVKSAQGTIVYALIVTDTLFNQSEKSPFIEVVVPDKEPPIASVITTIASQEKSFVINWLASPDKDLDKYILIKKTKDAKQEIAVSRNLSNYEDYDVQSGHSYWYSIVAIDYSGNVSDTSNIYKISRQGYDMSLLEGATPSSFTASYQKNKKMVRLEWKQVFNEHIVGVVVYGGEKEDKLSPMSSTSKKIGFQDKRVEEGKTYYYQLRTYATNGAKHQSEIVEVKVGKK